MAQGLVGLRLHPLFELFQYVEVEAPAPTLVGERGIGEAVAQHHIAPRECGFDHLFQMVAPCGKNQQGFGQRVHGLVKYHLA